MGFTTLGLLTELLDEVALGRIKTATKAHDCMVAAYSLAYSTSMMPNSLLVWLNDYRSYFMASRHAVAFEVLASLLELYEHGLVVMNKLMSLNSMVLEV